MRWNNFLILLILLTTSCAHRWPLPTGTALFPPGVYRHAVQIDIIETGDRYQLEGILKHTDQGLRLHALGPFQVSALEIAEDFSSGRTEIQVHLQALKAHERNLDRLYGLVRALVLFPKEQLQWQGLRVTERDREGRPGRFAAPNGIEIEVISYGATAPTNVTFTHATFRANLREVSL